jgi:CheY-like chemotaxis protein
VPRILIVDDDALIRELLDATLEIGDHEIHEAQDGSVAIEAAARAMPDVVLLDLDLGGAVDGLGVLVALKKGPAAKARVIVLTGSGRARESALMAAGAFAYVTKPFSPLDLIRRIEEALSA